MTQLLEHGYPASLVMDAIRRPLLLPLHIHAEGLRKQD
jgi:hypothetical protein